MPAVDALDRIDRALSAQFTLALACPLWRLLPYGVQPNPRGWIFDFLEIKPGHRASVRASIPWLPPRQDQMPLTFIMRIWHNQRASVLHRRLIAFDGLLRKPEAWNRGLPEPIFYDATAHALVYPCRPDLSPDDMLKINLRCCWMTRLIDHVMKIGLGSPAELQYSWH
jgi:hypothetical protein